MHEVAKSPEHGSIRATFTLHVVLPVLIGGTIYLLYRTENLYLFRWVSAVGGSSLVDGLRRYMIGLGEILPLWVRFVLPDGLWVYALTSCMLLIWGASGGRLWIFSGVAIAITSEIGQAVGYVPGTFDPLDLLVSMVAFAAAMLLIHPIPSHVQETSILDTSSRRFWSARGGKC